jgi:hypothetical protein
MPYLSNNPFSLAIIRGAESVKAINPSLAVVTSGPSPLGEAVVVGLAGVVVAVLFGLVQPCRIAVPRAVAPAVTINFLLDRLLITLLEALLYKNFSRSTSQVIFFLRRELSIKSYKMSLGMQKAKFFMKN